ncbi:MAG TPA: diacylglycerol kinase family protein [Planktothrix sp.]|jgi:diacylglycerol kinase
MNRPSGLTPESQQPTSRKRGPVGLVETHRAKRAGSRTFIPDAWQKKTGRATTLIESFYHAFHGLYLGLKEERNLRIHFCAAIVAAIMGVWLKLDALGWVAICLAMGFVITAEFLNTSLEHLVDLSARGQYHRSARYAKDTAAAAVLCASFVAAMVGMAVFIPRLIALFH